MPFLSTWIKQDPEIDGVQSMLPSLALHFAPPETELIVYAKARLLFTQCCPYQMVRVYPTVGKTMEECLGILSRG